jgi:hypothetical protein
MELPPSVMGEVPEFSENMIGTSPSSRREEKGFII